jgi:hypothetical protein
MLLAKEAREIVERTISEEIARETARANEFCEHLSKEIAEKAESKLSGFVFIVPHNVRRNYVINILQESGYQTEVQADGKVQIMW